MYNYLSKSFDRTNHSVLFDNLSYAGIQDFNQYIKVKYNGLLFEF